MQYRRKPENKQSIYGIYFQFWPILLAYTGIVKKVYRIYTMNSAAISTQRFTMNNVDINTLKII